MTIAPTHIRKVRAWRDRRGFTLVELLIALFLTGVVTTFILNTFIVQHKQMVVQDQIVDAQQNGRAAIDELTRQIRMAGYNLPLGLPPIFAYNTNPDTIVINYNTEECNATVTDPMPQPSAEIKATGQDLSCFYDGQWVYIFDPDSGGGEWFEVTQVQQAAGHLQHNTMQLSRTYGPGAILISLNSMKYYVDRADTAHPKLMLKINNKAAVVYAEGVEDLQFTYTMKNGDVKNTPPLAVDTREVKISLTARTRERDQDFLGNPYRLRQYVSSVNLRNLDI